MKRLLFALAFMSFATAYGAAEDTDNRNAFIIGEEHAEMDNEDYSAGLWGLGAFGAAILVSPLGGAGVILAAYYSGDEPVPLARRVWAQEEYSDNATALFMYSESYEETAKKIRRGANVRAAWIGAGVSIAVYIGVVIFYISIPYYAY